MTCGFNYEAIIRQIKTSENVVNLKAENLRPDTSTILFGTITIYLNILF